MTGAWGLPMQAELGGVRYAIHSDYRDVLELLRWLNGQADPALDQSERWYVAMRLFYPEFAALPQPLWPDATQFLTEFLAAGRREQPRPGPALMDWQQDAPLIAAGISKAAGQDVRTLPYLHWWSFLAWFDAIGEGSFATVVAIRDKLRRGKRLENRIDYGGYRAALGLPGTHQANHAAMAVEIALALWREFGYDISDDAILQGLADARMPARIEVLRRHPLLLLDGCHNPDGAKMLAATLTRADFEENLVGVLGVLADKDYKDMLSDLGPCFAKVYTVTPNCPRALSAEELQKEARFHTDAEAADSVADAIRKAVDYADENNLAGVVVCGSLYLAAEARPLLLKEAEK